MTRLLISLLCFIWFSACTDTTKVPSDILPQKKMERVMWDMVKADRFANGFYPQPPDPRYSKENAFKAYDGVFKIHGITKNEFLKSYKFYLGRPDLSRVMFDSITSRAERSRSEIYQSEASTDSTHRDSISSRSRRLKTDSVRLDSVRARLLRGRQLRGKQPARDSLK